VNPAALLREVRAHGGTLELRYEVGLTVVAPKPLPDALVTILRAHKPELIAYLQTELKRLVPAMCAKYSEGDVARCLRGALADPVEAWRSYTFLASQKTH
jgi:hypothetical protein